MLAVVAVNVHRAGQIADGTGDPQGLVRGHAVVADPKMHAAHPKCPCPFNAGLGAIDRYDRSNPKSLEGVETCISFRTTAADKFVGIGVFPCPCFFRSASDKASGKEKKEPRTVQAGRSFLMRLAQSDGLTANKELGLPVS
jgi:hypothetical protein